MRARRIATRMLAAVLATIAVAGCDDIPRDSERTEALIRESGTIRVGWVTGVEADPSANSALASLSSATGARVERRPGDSETLLGELEDGKIDLVYGSFAEDSPWAMKVHLAHPPGFRAKPPKTVEAPRFALRNGENAWIMRVEMASRP